MKPRTSRARTVFQVTRNLIGVLCMVVIAPGDMSVFATLAPSAEQATEQATEQAAKIPPDQLDSLVAPIALYPDPLLTQTLVASTYPLEVIQLQQWLAQNKSLKDKALDEAVKKQDWDPSIQGLAALPDVVKQMAENIKWTTDLGNAFLVQQSDVMDAVQRMRKKAKDAGNLKSNEQQKVETKTVESKTVVVIEQASPQVVYVPSYNPVVVYGAPVYPYPPIAYPPPGYYAAGMAISFGVGIAMGAAWGGGGWGYNSGWGHNDVNVNVNNNYVRNTNNKQNINNANRPSTQPARGNNNTWQHNPQHRGGAPYSDRATAKQYGGTARGDSASTRQANARQNQSQRDRQPSQGNDRNRQQSGSGDRNRQQPSTADRSAGGRDNSSRGNSAGGDRVGNREVSKSPSSNNKSAFGGASSGMSGNAARASSQRGSSSMGARGGGGGGGGRRR
jgi:hypothetical protein